MNNIPTQMVVTILGKGAFGRKERIEAIVMIASILAGAGADIVEISQTGVGEFFALIVLVDLKNAKMPVSELGMLLCEAGQELGIRVDVIREERLPSRVGRTNQTLSVRHEFERRGA
jgi:ACT domain-containing protein